MMRLVQGDVGSGKTLVAALASLKRLIMVNRSLMAPTGCEQHATNFRHWFAPLKLMLVGLLEK